MRDQIDQPQSKQHNLVDWLDLHKLDHKTCLRLLHEISREAAEIPTCRNRADRQPLNLDPDGVWRKITSAMFNFLPEHKSLIEETFQRSKKIAVDGQGKSRKALTIDHGPAQYPTILYNYFGDISDLFVVAHEFGHAVQIRASEGKFMTPIMREICAFLSEGAMLSYCLKEDDFADRDLLKHWQRSSHRYFGKRAIDLEIALRNDNAIYEYGWNYPIARLLAIRISNNFSREMLWNVFSGDYSVRRVLNQLAM